MLLPSCCCSYKYYILLHHDATLFQYILGVLRLPFYILHLNKHFLPTTTHYYCDSTTATATTTKGSYSPRDKSPLDKVQPYCAARRLPGRPRHWGWFDSPPGALSSTFLAAAAR